MKIYCFQTFSSHRKNTCTLSAIIANLTTMKENVAPSINIRKVPRKLQLNINEEEFEDVEDEEDEKKIMSVLIKLQQAKQALETSRKRKNLEKEMEDIHIAFKKDTKAMTFQFRKKWQLKTNEMKSRLDDLINNADALKQRASESKKANGSSLRQIQDGLLRLDSKVGNILHQMKDLEGKLEDASTMELQSLSDEIAEQVKLIENKLVKIQCDSKKGDKISKLLETIISDL